jgi:agmatinase
MSDGSFDPGGVGVHNGNYFGFPWEAEACDIVIVNVPWDATTSYRRGTANGPGAMIQASTQLDFYSFDNPGAPLVRCGTDNSLHQQVIAVNETAGALSAKAIRMLEEGIPQNDPRIVTLTQQVNSMSAAIETLVHDRCRHWISQGKRVIVAGGEHSVPLGFLKALSEVHSSFGILQIDAHADLRIAYEGFEQSHASIMYNAMQLPRVTRLAQVGIRDVSHAEMALAAGSERISLFSDNTINTNLFAGSTWFEQCRDIVSVLPQQVYISFDIDGLDPAYCPNTGTPVAGGLSPDAAMYLIRMVAESGREIIGADLCEVAPGSDEWDASNGARVLYRTAVLMHHSHQPTMA